MSGTYRQRRNVVYLYPDRDAPPSEQPPLLAGRPGQAVPTTPAAPTHTNVAGAAGASLLALAALRRGHPAKDLTIAQTRHIYNVLVHCSSQFERYGVLMRLGYDKDHAARWLQRWLTTSER